MLNTYAAATAVNNEIKSDSIIKQMEEKWDVDKAAIIQQLLKE